MVNTQQEVFNYGVKCYNDKLSTANGDKVTEGMWYRQMEDGFIAGTYTVVVRALLIHGMLQPTYVMSGYPQSTENLTQFKNISKVLEQE